MFRQTLGAIILLVIMLNHAVAACDAMIMHMPDHDHAYTSLSDTHTDSDNNADSQHHSPHAHVSCHIAFFNGIDLLHGNDCAVDTLAAIALPVSYAPPVPPPNV
jgi:hypothetical protein